MDFRLDDGGFFVGEFGGVFLHLVQQVAHARFDVRHVARRLDARFPEIARERQRGFEEWRQAGAGVNFAQDRIEIVGEAAQLILRGALDANGADGLHDIEPGGWAAEIVEEALGDALARAGCEAEIGNFGRGAVEQDRFIGPLLDGVQVNEAKPQAQSQRSSAVSNGFISGCGISGHQLASLVSGEDCWRTVVSEMTGAPASITPWPA